MASELIAGLSLFKTMLDMAKGLKDMNDTVVRNAAIIELQEKILAAREQQSALAERVGDLEKEVVRLKAWDTEKERYQLTTIADGKLAYTLKEGVQPPEPEHKLCANCYDQGQKSILQKESRMPARTQYLVCNRCGADIVTRGDRRPEHTKARRRR